MFAAALATKAAIGQQEGDGRMVRKTFFTMAIVAGIFTAGGATAADSNFYVAGSIGRSKVDVDGTAVDTNNRANGFTSSATATSTGATSGKVQLGYSFSRSFSIEGGYAYLGKATFISATNLGSIAGKKEASAWNLDLVGAIPVSDHFSVFGRLGGYRWQTRNDLPNAATASTRSITDNGWDIKFGAGIQYDITRNFALRAEAERFNGVGNNATTGDSKVTMYSAGAVLKF